MKGNRKRNGLKLDAKWFRNHRRIDSTSYLRVLNSYKRLMGQYRKMYKGCLPIPPPSASAIVRKSQASRRCTKGYRAGFQIGKSWAQMVRASKGAMSVGVNGMKCARTFLSGRKQSVYNLCAIRGMKAGYKKFWALLQDKKALRQWRRNRRAIDSSRHNARGYYANLAKAINGN